MKTTPKRESLAEDKFNGLKVVVIQQKKGRYKRGSSRTIRVSHPPCDLDVMTHQLVGFIKKLRNRKRVEKPRSKTVFDA